MKQYKDVPEHFILNSFINVENQLIEILNVIPYCKEHENVWSPLLIPIIQDSCSQIDSLWNLQAKQSSYIKKWKLGIKDYFTYFGEDISSKIAIFFGKEKPELVQPFAEWYGIPKYDIDTYKDINWWADYNKIKHNRLYYRNKATIKNAVHSLAGLFLAIIKCPLCRNGVVQTGWVSARYPNLVACLSEDSPSSYMNYCVVESKLFTYPIGWNGREVPRDWNWSCFDASQRFINWFDEYEGKL